MNSCGNLNIGTKLSGSKCLDAQKETSVADGRGIESERGDNKAYSSYGTEDFNVRRGTLVICQRNAANYSSENTFWRYKSRIGSVSRNEFGMARGGGTGDRARGATRGRAFKKAVPDRDTNAESGFHPTTRSKFQEPLKNQETSQGKYYDDKRINEDSRISKLLRRLCREDDADHFMVVCKQAQEGITAPENQRYVRRNLELICENLLDVLHGGPGPEAKQQIAKCLGRVGYAVEQDFKRYMDWVFGKFSVERKDDVKCLLIKSFGEVFRLNAETPKLKDFAAPMMSQLQSTLENVDRSDLLVATVDAILLIIESYPETFTSHFRDTVDILVGWHIDSTQEKTIAVYASRSLQKLRNFWIADLQFTLTLLGQFLEDMESYDEELTLPESGRSSPGDEGSSPTPRECILRITSLISVFNTVTKSVSEHLNPNQTPSVQWTFLTDCLSKMLKTVVRAIELNDFSENSEGTGIIKGGRFKFDGDKQESEKQTADTTLTSKFDAMIINKDGRTSGWTDDNDLGRDNSLNRFEESTLAPKTNKLVDLSEETEELILVANECAFLLLGYLQSRITKNHELLYKFIDLQLERVHIFWDDTIISMLTTISKVIKEVSANLPLELVHKLLGKDSALLKLRFRDSASIQNASLAVYHSLLSLKNIPLLQESYRYVLADLEIAYKLVLNDVESLVADNPLDGVAYQVKDAEVVVTFLLRALSDIANASNSIIGMWALKPSILELFAVKLRPYDSNLLFTGRYLQYSILYLLYAHCSRYNHFIPSSSLITGTASCRPIDMFPNALDVPTTSPTSGHLSIILDLIAKTCHRRMWQQTFMLLCSWTREIFMQSENYMGILSKTKEHENLVSRLIRSAATTNADMAMAICEIFEILTGMKNVVWREEIYTSIVGLAMFQLKLRDKRVRERYASLLMRLPLNIVISNFNKECTLLPETKKIECTKSRLHHYQSLGQRLRMSGNTNWEMQVQLFKTYMAFLLQEHPLDETALWEMLTLCRSNVSANESTKLMYRWAAKDRTHLFFWAGFEAAQHCVISKLRTSLGKPQETFTSIECALKKLAREISCHSIGTEGPLRKDGNKRTDDLLHEHTRVRLFVEFLEQLEREIHNAAEGCAIALPPVAKPVRTFFHTNKSTCKEWLNRIRLALCALSLHAGLASIALRNGQRLLEELTISENTQGIEFERATLYTAQAMLMLGEREALQGLYVYVKENIRGLSWLEGAIHEAACEYESAVEKYKNAVIESYEFSRSARAVEDDGMGKPATGAEFESQTMRFCIQRIPKCYEGIADWDGFSVWMDFTESSLPEKLVSNSSISSRQVLSLRKFKDGEAITLDDLMDWNVLEKGTRTNWDYSRTVVECSNTLINLALRLRIDERTARFTEDIERCRKIATQLLEEGLRNVPSECMNDSLMLCYLTDALKNVYSGRNVNMMELCKIDNTTHVDSSVLTRILWWTECLGGALGARGESHDEIAMDISEQVADLRLHIVRTARKENNFELAKRQLSNYFKSERDVGQILCRNFWDFTDRLVENPIRVKWSRNNMRAFTEYAKLLYDMKATNKGIKVCSVAASSILQTILNGEQSADLRETGSKLLLTLGTWIQEGENDSMADNEQLDDLLKSETVQNDGLNGKLFGSVTNTIPTTDPIIGKLTQLAVNQCPDLPEAWSSFAAWCYKRGREIVDNSISAELTETDITKIEVLLPVDLDETDRYRIMEILVQNKTIPQDEGGIDTDDAKISKIIENQLLINVPALTWSNTDLVGMLVDIWKQARRRLYSYYEFSANAYFKYLLLANREDNDSETITATLRILRLVRHASKLQTVLESGFLTTPAGPWKAIIPQLFSRLSHPEVYVRAQVSDLLCRITENSPHLTTFPAVVGAISGQRKPCEMLLYENHVTRNYVNSLDWDERLDDEINDQEETGHKEKNSGQMGHVEEEEEDDAREEDGGLEDEEDDEDDEEDVEEEEEDDAMLDGEEDEEDEEEDGIDDEKGEQENGGEIEKELKENLLGYEDEENEEEAAGDEEEDEIEDEDVEHQKFMDCCFSQLVDCLSKKIPDSIEQVKILVKELRRITLLWDELWLATLCKLQTEINEMFERLDIEIRKVHENGWLSVEEKEKLITAKYRIILKPLVVILENLHTVTSVPAETPHEKNFQDRFGGLIEETISSLKNRDSAGKTETPAQLLKQLGKRLAQRVNRRGVYSLSMADISPTLANLKDTCIAMPGIAAQGNNIVTIRSVGGSVLILPTKTKPKKCVFQGSDGRMYTYLFKGWEDLRLDERIMQFLNVCNTMMSKDCDSKKVYRARHYSVIPLGPRSGLIQWVDGVTPLYLFYKRWQHREAGKTVKTNNTASAISRPGGSFYDKLTPLLKEHGIALEDRKEWPVQILKQVLTELMVETPKDLLAKEIWCNSINAGTWWQATKNYSYSVAVMSIIGYIIGLGDRHLLNILIDICTGEVVHIDYNVCFEKGKTLRVPENVPFRMTPNIRTALGVTGVEGIFRLACEHTLEVMRRGRETLLTLLEAFIYDPLVDWRAGADNNIATYGTCQTRSKYSSMGLKQLERKLTRAMFAIRTEEMRAEWLSNRKDLLKALQTLHQQLNGWLEAMTTSRHCYETLQDRHQQLALIKEAQAMGRNHPIYTLVKRFNSFKRARDAHRKAKAGLKKKIEDCEKQINLHNLAIIAVRGPQLGQWMTELGGSTNQEEHVVFDLVKEFLQNAGQSQMVVMCERSENELTQLATQQSMLIRNCLDLLSQYSAICSLYPISSLSQHRTVLYHKWANTLLASESVEACHEVVRQFETYFEPVCAAENQDKTSWEKMMTFRQMRIHLKLAEERLKKAYDRMVAEGLPESIEGIEKAYRDSRLQIQVLLSREKGAAKKALECVHITTLCKLNERYLMMEGAAKCVGEGLVNLFSREGDWFLDEMRLMSSLITELVSLIPENHKTNNDPQISLILKCLKGSDCIYKGLQELNYNFETIILPEATRTVITEETSVLRVMSELDEIIVSSGLPLRDILGQLEKHMRFTIMEMESPQAAIQKVVSNMRMRFEALLSRQAEVQEPNQEENLTAGQMLLMGFNGLFEKLQTEGNSLVTSLSTVEIPPSWKKIDQIRAAKEMSAPISNKAACQVLEDIFFIKRLNTIREFFMMCQGNAVAFKGGRSGIYEDESLSKPIRVFTADYVSRQLLGVTSQALAIALCFLLQRMGLNVTTEIEQRDIGAESKVSIEELCRKLVDLRLKGGCFGGSVLAQVSALSSTLESAARRKHSAWMAQQSVKVARAGVSRAQLQLTAHQWLHDDIVNLNPDRDLDRKNPLNRSAFMLELRKTAAALSNLQSRVCEAREQQQNLVNSALLRLKWAAGANPALGEVMAAFDNAVALSCDKLTRQHNLASAVINTCNSILHYEALRTRTSESHSQDASFIKLVKHWEESCMLTMNLTTTVTPVEESLLELLQMEGNVDVNWLKQAERLVSEAALTAHKDLCEKEQSLRGTEERVREQSRNLQVVLIHHRRLMSNVRVFLQTMAKQGRIVGLQEFRSSYRTFFEGITKLVNKLLETDNIECHRAKELTAELMDIAMKVPNIYEDLLNLAVPRKPIISGQGKEDLHEKDGVASSEKHKVTSGIKMKVTTKKKRKKKRKRKSSIRKEGECFNQSQRRGLLPKNPTRRKAMQERNAYALNVWQRVRMKLEGRDPDPNRVSTTAEVVDYVIREATSINNLALLYEGWAPWI